MKTNKNIKFRIWDLPKYGENYNFSKKIYEVIILGNESVNQCILRSDDKKELFFMSPTFSVSFSHPLSLYVSGFVHVKDGNWKIVRVRFVTDEFAQEHSKEYPKDEFKDYEVEDL